MPLSSASAGAVSAIGSGAVSGAFSEAPKTPGRSPDPDVVDIGLYSCGWLALGDVIAGCC